MFALLGNVLQLLDKWGYGVLQLGKRDEIMKNRNPYLSLLVLWIGAICFSLSACVFGIVNGFLWQALFNLALVVFDSVFLGWCICKFNAYRDFINYMKEMEEKMKSVGGLCAEEEPFKEFENGKE